MKRVALVTGGSRGLGRDMVLSFAKKGFDVIFTYNTSEKEAEDVKIAGIELGANIEYLQLNVGDISIFDTFVEKVKILLDNNFSGCKLHSLVNNAGIGMYTMFENVTEEQFDLLMNIHFKGTFFLSQKLLSILEDGGSIVNISSGLTRFSRPGMSVYASMKAAVETLTRYMAKELGSRGIRVNIVAPGPIATDFGGGANKTPQYDPKTIVALGRIGYADDIGGVVTFLCSEDAKWISGQRIEVSGGMNI